jgi:L-serine dehydratase
MYSIKSLLKSGNGPSSSHTMGPRNAILYILGNYPNYDFYQMNVYGSLALTGKGHLLDVIAEETLKNVPHQIIFDEISEFPHPNTMVFKLFKNKKMVKEIQIVSIGGGYISIDGKANDAYQDVYPHSTFDQIKNYCQQHSLTLVEYIKYFEDKDILDYMEKIYNTMLSVVDNGLKKDGLLPGKLKVSRKAKEIYSKIFPNEDASRREKRLISAYAFAAAEENASGAIVVTAPTCGASGILPSLVRYYQEQGYSHQDIIDSLLVSGLIGLIIRENASISGAECGCQAEIGSACSMGAAFISSLKKENILLIERAAEIAMEHSLGLTCDPIQGYVQIPCIERNAIGALRAIEASSLTDFIDTTNSKISFDTVVKTMYETGKDLNKSYRETSKGGLAKNFGGK